MISSVSSRVRVRPVLAHDEADSSAHVLVVERLGLLEVDAVPRPRRLLVPEKKCETLYFCFFSYLLFVPHQLSSSSI